MISHIGDVAQPGGTLECMPLDGPRGERCLAGPDWKPACLPMECSEEGTVLVDGQPCDPGAPHLPLLSYYFNNQPSKEDCCDATECRLPLSPNKFFRWCSLSRP